jgi:threonine dehydratase
LVLSIPTLEDLEAAREIIAPDVVSSPLLRLEGVHPSADVYLKAECLQPIGSFKLRGALNALRQADGGVLLEGVYTASAGNMAQGLAWAASRSALRSTAVMPDNAPAAKVKAVERLGGQVIQVPFERWWQVLQEGRYPGLSGHFLHPVADQAVIEGNGTIGLELVEDLDRLDAVFVPFGGGGLSCGISAALAALRPGTRVIGCEVETAAPLAASLAADEPCQIERRASFVDGIGGGGMLVEMWPLVRELVPECQVVAVAEIEAAIRLLVDRRSLVAEGAGGAALAAALAQPELEGVVVCVISGGNIDPEVLSTILRGEST